jgi:hypothetical protein
VYVKSGRSEISVGATWLFTLEGGAEMLYFLMQEEVFDGDELKGRAGRTLIRDMSREQVILGEEQVHFLRFDKRNSRDDVQIKGSDIRVSRLQSPNISTKVDIDFMGGMLRWDLLDDALEDLRQPAVDTAREYVYTHALPGEESCSGPGNQADRRRRLVAMANDIKVPRARCRETTAGSFWLRLS